MRVQVFAVLLVVLLPGCASGEPADSSSTTASTIVTSSTASTSPTSSSTTTSPTIPPTTSTTLLDGNWADVPVITSSVWSMVLGWWDGSQWVQATDGMQIGVDGGEDYQVALIGSSGIVQGGPQVQACVDGLPNHPGIELSDPDALSTHSGSEVPGQIAGVAISAAWEITPRPVTQGEAHPDLEAIAADLLRRAGYETESARLVQSIDADLDDDGALETIVVAEDTELGNSVSDVYSIVFVVTPIAVDPLVVESSVIPAGQEGFPASFRVGAVADLNGDGNMEIVLSATAWEGQSVAVFQLAEGEFARRLIVGCGA